MTMDFTTENAEGLTVDDLRAFVDTMPHTVTGRVYGDSGEAVRYLRVEIETAAERNDRLPPLEPLRTDWGDPYRGPGYRAVKGPGGEQIEQSFETIAHGGTFGEPSPEMQAFNDLVTEHVKASFAKDEVLSREVLKVLYGAAGVCFNATDVWQRVIGFSVVQIERVLERFVSGNAAARFENHGEFAPTYEITDLGRRAYELVVLKLGAEPTPEATLYAILRREARWVSWDELLDLFTRDRGSPAGYDGALANVVGGSTEGHEPVEKRTRPVGAHPGGFVREFATAEVAKASR